MAGDLGFLFDGTPPPSVTGNIASIQGLPDWYQEYLRGIAGQATSLAGMQADQAVPAQSIAGFTPDQIAAFQKVRANQGAWQPALDNQAGALASVQPAVQNAVQTATDAAGAPAAKWTDNFQQYMSPYTTQVVDNIGRLGQRNWEEKVLPGLNQSFIGAGQFGSTRNADIVARAGRDAAADITGQQAAAMEQGYGTSANIFTNDANRAQAQGQIAANTALSGGQLAATAGLGTGQQYGALGSATAGLGLTDAQSLAASGQQQQALDQTGLNTAYGNAQSLNNWDWNILNNMQSVVRGMQLPTSNTISTNQPVTGTQSYSQAPLTQFASYFGTQAPGKARGGRVMPRHQVRARGALSFAGG